MNAKELLFEINVPQNVYTNLHASKMISIFNLVKSIKKDIIDSAIVDQIEKYPIGKRTTMCMNYSGEGVINDICSGYDVAADQFLVQTKTGEYIFICPVACELHTMFCNILGIENNKQIEEITEKITFAPELITKLKKAIKYTQSQKDIITKNNDHVSILIKDGLAEVCANDLHLLYLSEKIKCKGKNQQILINPRSFSKIRAIKEKDFKLNVEFSVFKKDNVVFANFCGVNLVLTEGEYPNYKPIIPDYTEKMIFNQMDIYNLVRQVKKSANEVSEVIHLHLNGKIEISAFDEYYKTKSLSAINYENKTFPDMDVDFNGSQFLKAVEVFDSENIEMYSEGNNQKCALFKAENSKDVAMLMPFYSYDRR